MANADNNNAAGIESKKGTQASGAGGPLSGKVTAWVASDWLSA
jgi:hypothetical protein